MAIRSASHRAFLRATLALAVFGVAVFVARWLPGRHVGIEAPADAAPTVSPFTYSFDGEGVLSEAERAEMSSSPYFWLDSGGEFWIREGIGKTIHGDLPEGARWRGEYRQTNPRDTEDGTRPQNVFRLLTRSTWDNVRAAVRFRITRIAMSGSENRTESNGVLLMSRYQDSENLYYAGVRVDGAAVIKKKVHGEYYTMMDTPLFTGAARLPDRQAGYDRDTNPNLIPGNVWMGLRSEIRTNPDGTVRVTLSVDREGRGEWEEVLAATDDGTSYGGAPIINAGYAGIRTDFMDVEFDDYALTALEDKEEEP